MQPTVESNVSENFIVGIYYRIIRITPVGELRRVIMRLAGADARQRLHGLYPRIHSGNLLRELIEGAARWGEEVCRRNEEGNMKCPHNLQPPEMI